MKINYNKILILLAILMTSPLCYSVNDSSYAKDVDDDAIVVSVKAKFEQDKNLHGLDITVISQDGIVILDGVVNNQAQIDAAINSAKSIEGVKDVQASLDIENPTN